MPGGAFVWVVLALAAVVTAGLGRRWMSHRSPDRSARDGSPAPAPWQHPANGRIGRGWSTLTDLSQQEPHDPSPRG